MSSTFDCVDKRKRLEFAPGLPSPGSRLIPELAQDFFIRASQGASPINATEEDSSMPLADPGSTTPGMEGALMALASDALQAEASGGGDGSSTVDTISAESTPPSTQVTQPEAPPTCVSRGRILANQEEEIRWGATGSPGGRAALGLRCTTHDRRCVQQACL